MPPDRHLHCCRRLVPSWFTVGPAFTVGPELVQAARSDRYRSESGRALCWACVVLAMVGHARARARRPRSAPRSADRTLIEKFLEEVVDSLFALRSSVAAPGASPLAPGRWTCVLHAHDTGKYRLYRQKSRCHGRRLTWVCGGRADERSDVLEANMKVRDRETRVRRARVVRRSESGERVT